MNRLSGPSQPSSSLIERVVETISEPVSIDGGVEGITQDVVGNHISLECGTPTQSLTPTTELNSTKWRNLFRGPMQIFADADDFKKTLYKYSVANKFEYKYQRNSSSRMSVRCKVHGCKWKLTANAVGKTSSLLRVTTFNDEPDHSAQDHLKVSNSATSSLTSSLVMDEISNHNDKKPTEIRKILLTDYSVQLTYKQAYRAKEKALEELQGRPKESYMLIPWICHRLQETDHRTVAKWDSFEPVVGHHIFTRVFIAYGCCIEGFLAGARYVLYIDGTHLSGPFQGTLLAASAYDANNDLLPSQARILCVCVCVNVDVCICAYMFGCM